MNALKRLHKCSLFALLMPCAPLMAEVNYEHKIKAEVVYKILHFVTWPSEGGRANNITLCVAKGDPFRKAFEHINDYQTGHPGIELIAPQRGMQDLQCSAEFSSLSQRENELIDMGRKNSPAVLSIGNSADFAVRGGMINLDIRQRRVGFTINLEASKRANLEISSALLRLANIVGPPPKDQHRRANEPTGKPAKKPNEQ